MASKGGGSSDEKLPWGLKQSAPGSMKTITKDKLEAFEQGVMNIPKKQLSKREQDELKKKHEEEAAAEVLHDYVATFEDNGKTMKTFIKGSTINPSTKEEHKNKPVLYKPSPKIQEKFSSMTNRTTPVKEQHDKKDRDQLRLKKNPQEKRKSNLETFKEELKKIQEEREARHKNKAKSESGGDDFKTSKKTEKPVDIKSELEIKTADDTNLNGKQIPDESTTTNIFLSNLSPYTNEKDLMEMFGQYGPLASVKIMWPRSEEEKSRGNNCGFVAYMIRKDAENGLKELDGTVINGLTLRLSWSKSVHIPTQPVYIPPDLLEVTVPPPPSGLPFNAQPQKRAYNNNDEYMNYYDDIDKKLENAIVKVTIPTERPLLCLIHRMVEFVVREGPEFEAIIMAKEINNPQFRFLYDNQCPAHIYYRWRLFSILQGDSLCNWYTDSFEMFKNGSMWIPPTLNSFTKGEADDSYDRARNELESKKGRLSNEKRDKLEDILRNLSIEKASIGSAMVFCIDHADCAEEICECIIESLSISHTPLNKKIARLFLISDILHNCSVKVANASYYRRGFEKYLPDLFKHINSVWLDISGKLKSESFKRKVVACIRVWEDQAIYTMDFLSNLKYIFLNPLIIKKSTQNTDSNSSNENNTDQNNKQESASSASEKKILVSEDIDGKPLFDIKNYESGDESNADDIDGKPFNPNEEYDDIDGKPLSEDEDENKSKNSNREPAKFITSKWEQVDPEQLEKQAITTSKWDFFDDYQSDRNSNENSQDNSDEKYDENSDNLNQQKQQQSFSDSIQLYQQYSQHKEQLSEEKRQMLRDIEVKAVKYMDDLENGKAERNLNITIQEQVESYRHFLFRKNIEQTQSKNGNSNIKTSSSTSGTNNNNNNRNTHQHSESINKRASRSRSRSPTNRHQKSSSSKKQKSRSKSRSRSRTRSRSRSPSRHYKKKRY